MSRGESRRSFTRTASRKHAKNFNTRIMRGGYRL